MERALFISAATLAALLVTGCELVAGIHEREVYEAPPSDAGSDAPACPEGAADCDGNADNGCEVLLATDPKNCGACGHDCLEDGCAASACVPVVMTDGESTPEALAVSDAGLYWSNSKGVVRKLPLEGGNVQTIGDAPPAGQIAFGIALSDQSVYWTLFATTPADQKPGVVMRATLDGVSPTAIFTNQRFPTGLAVDATSVYWAAAYDDLINRGPSNGGMFDSIATLSFGSLPLDVIVDKDHVYWTNYLDGTVLRVSKVQGGATEKLAKYQDNPFVIAQNEKAIFWTNLSEGSYMEGSVWALSKDAPEGTLPTPVAELQYAPNAITADETAVYWSTLGHDVGDKAPGTGTLWKLPVGEDGLPVPGAQPTAIAVNQNSPTALKVFKHILYWTTGASGGQVFRMIQ